MPPRRGAPQKGNDLLFTLIPQNDEAKAIVALNPTHVTNFLGAKVLACYADRPSQILGRLLSFGRNESHDIRLPSEPPFPGARNDNTNGERGVRGRQNYGNYRNDHFFFFLAASGELILRDLSPCLTAIELEHADSKEASLYGLHGKSPRQRVIPRTTRSVFIIFGTSTCFMLKWARGYQGEDDDTELAVQSKLAGRALALHMSGMILTAPDEDTPVLPMYHFHELRSRHTPSGGSSLNGHIRPIHSYGGLGSGTFGQVSKAVDLTSGELWAVKKIKRDANHDNWKKSFLAEVTILQDLRHENIVHFETYQDFQIGGQYQLFFQLYKGNVYHLITKPSQHSCEHSCDGPARDHDIQPSFWTRFIDQMCSAVAYLHTKKIVHRDIKPQNVMYDYVDGTDELSFFLGDFGLSNTAADMKMNAPGGGTPFYNAPELASTNTPTKASDIWALGVMFGEVRGYWCHQEVGRSANFWNRKLAAYGCANLVHEDPPMVLPQSITAWPHRVLSFTQGTLIPVALARMMSKPASRRPTAAQLTRTAIADFTEPPRRSAVELNPKMAPGLRPAQDSASHLPTQWAMNAVTGLMHAPIQQHPPRYNHPHNAPVHQGNAPMRIPAAPQPAVEEFKTPTTSEVNNMIQVNKTLTDSDLYNMYLLPAYHQSDGSQAAQRQGQSSHIPHNRPPPATITPNARLPTAAPRAGQPAPNGGMPRPNPTTTTNNNHRSTHQRPPPPDPAPASTTRTAAADTARPASRPGPRPGPGPGPGPNYRPTTVENTPRALQRQQGQQRVTKATRPPAAAAAAAVSRGVLGGGGGGRGQEGSEGR